MRRMNDLHIILESIYPTYQKEYRFHNIRRWRFDFAYPDEKIAFEYEGIYSKMSGHTTWKGFAGDCEKYNYAQELGWKVYRFTWDMLQKGETVDFIKKVLGIPTKSKRT